MKKLAVLGGGIASCLSVAHFLKHSNWEIDWYIDNQLAYAESTNVELPSQLAIDLEFTHDDLTHINGTVNLGIRKRAWGQKTPDFCCNYVPPTVGWHLDTGLLQNLAIERVKNNNRVNVLYENVTVDVDSDLVMDCRYPADNSKLLLCRYSLVDAGYTVECSWAWPQFQHTMQIARPWGWVLVVPLQNSCSLRSFYSTRFTDLTTVKQDLEQVLKDLNLTPNGLEQLLPLNFYYAATNFTNRVIRNGPSSFFMEPFESFNTSLALKVILLASSVWQESMSPIYAQNNYVGLVQELENIQAVHYYSGSAYQTPFWSECRTLAEHCLSFADNRLYEAIDESKLDSNCTRVSYGTWNKESWKLNAANLDFYNKFNDLQKPSPITF